MTCSTISSWPIDRRPRAGHVEAMITSPPLIETDRLRLRPPRFSDKDVHIAMWADPRVTRFLGGDPRTPAVSWGKFMSSAGPGAAVGVGDGGVAYRGSEGRGGG